MEKENTQPNLREKSLPQATRVLVVDNDESLNHLLSQRLEKEGFQVASVLTGAQAIASIKTSAYRILLLASSFPDMDVNQLVETLAGMKIAAPVRHNDKCGG